MVHEIDSDTGEQVIKYKVVAPVPEEIEKFAFSCMSHVKNAFDQGTFNAALALGVELSGSTYFPWSTGPADMVGRLRRAKVPEELWDIFRNQQPYKRFDSYVGGDDVVRGFATLANKKHTTGLSVLGDVVHLSYPTIHGLGPDHPESDRQELSVTVGGKWDAEKQEIDIVRYTGKVHVYPDHKISLNIFVSDPAFASPVRVVDGLSTFLESAQTFYNRLRSKCEELRGA
jgi:hypothetical protein